MSNTRYVFGPVPSRRMGRSLGVSPIPEKTCNYSCIYCQLGRTNHMTNTRKEFFPLEDILSEVKSCLADHPDDLDVISIVGEGEPTLYARLGDLIRGIQGITDVPVAVITNGALLSDPHVREELMAADIVLPSMDGYDESSYKKTDRPFGQLHYEDVHQGLVEFSHAFQGQLFLEIMLMGGVNDSDEDLKRFQKAIKDIKYDRVYINTPVRPPAEADVHVSSEETLRKASLLLGGISIESLAQGSFFSEAKDDYDAILGIIGRHPMNQHEIRSFLESRKNPDPNSILERLNHDEAVVPMDYKGYTTYRLRLK